MTSGRRVVLFCNRSVGRAAARAFLEPGPWVPVAIVVDDRGRTGSGPPSFAVEAGKRGVPILREASVNSPASLARMRDLRADLFVVLGFSQRLGEEVLALPPDGVLNLHTSLLPQYRGATPNYWMVREGAAKAGVTAHWMASTIDSGPIIAQRESPIHPTETGKELETRLAGLAAALMRDVLSRPGAIPRGTPQDPARATSHPPFRAQHAVVDLTKPAGSILAQVRAARGWIEPTVMVDGQARVVLGVRLLDRATVASSPPGHAGGERLVVVRPDGTVEFDLGPTAVPAPSPGGFMALRARLSRFFGRSTAREGPRSQEKRP